MTPAEVAVRALALPLFFGVAGTATATLPRAPAVALAVSAAALALPALAPPVPWLRALLGLGALWHLVRVSQLARDPAPRAPIERLWHQVGVVDTRLAVPAPPRLDLGLAARLAAGGLLGAGSLLGAAFAPALPLRWFAGAWFVYGVAEVLFAGVAFSYRLAGVEVGTLHDDPVAARSLREFWGRRWNRVVGRWLHDDAFVPLAAAGHPALGTAAAFGLSALLHVHFAASGAGLAMGACMGAFFLVQGALMLVERAIRIEDRGALAGRIWTLGTLFASCPLFVEPFLRLVPV